MHVCAKKETVINIARLDGCCVAAVYGPDRCFDGFHDKAVALSSYIYRDFLELLLQPRGTSFFADVVLIRSLTSNFMTVLLSVFSAEREARVRRSVFIAQRHLERSVRF